ncbi:MAG: DUF3263 domain-containing protein [Acidimicrobiia bacterium]
MLTDEDRTILEFERGWWLEPGPKDQAIELSLGLPAAVYYDRLLAIIAMAESYRVDPLTVTRVRSMIEPDPAGEAAVS